MQYCRYDDCANFTKNSQPYCVTCQNSASILTRLPRVLLLQICHFLTKRAVFLNVSIGNHYDNDYEQHYVRIDEISLHRTNAEQIPILRDDFDALIITNKGFKIYVHDVHGDTKFGIRDICSNYPHTRRICHCDDCVEFSFIETTQRECNCDECGEETIYCQEMWIMDRAWWQFNNCGSNTDFWKSPPRNLSAAGF